MPEAVSGLLTELPPLLEEPPPKTRRAILMSEQTSLYDKHIYQVVSGCLEFSVLIDEQPVRFVYPAGRLFRVYAGERRKGLVWTKGTCVAIVAGPQQPELDSCVLLSFFNPAARQYFSAIAEKRCISLKALVLESGKASQQLFVVAGGQFRRRSRGGEAVLTAGEEFASECLIGLPSCKVSCLVHNSTLLTLPMMEVRRAMAVLPVTEQQEIHAFIARKQALFADRPSLPTQGPKPEQKKFLFRRRSLGPGPRDSQAMPPILAHSHLLLRVRIRNPVLRFRGTSKVE